MKLCTLCRPQVAERILDVCNDIDRLPSDTRPGINDMWYETVDLATVRDMVQDALGDILDSDTASEPTYVFTAPDIQVLVAIEADGRARLSTRHCSTDTWSPPHYSTLGG
jgi:hypothetical protein